MSGVVGERTRSWEAELELLRRRGEGREKAGDTASKQHGFWYT